MGAAVDSVGTGAAVVTAVVIVGEAVQIGSGIVVGGAMGAGAVDDIMYCIILKNPVGSMKGAG